MEIIDREPRTKQRKIILKKDNISRDVDSLSYKLADSVAEGDTKDAIASDSNEILDGVIIGRLIDGRVAELYKRLEFCLEDVEIESADDDLDLTPSYEFRLLLPERFKDTNLRSAASMMHDYVVKGVLVDWYNHTGVNYGRNLEDDVVRLESAVVSMFRVPGFVHHYSIPFEASYKIR